MGDSINEWVKEIHELAKKNGWWDKPRSDLEIAALIHSEVSEFVEHVRDPHQMGDYYLTANKPDGKAIELIDVLIRIMDYFGYKSWDMERLLEMKHEYNKIREYRHGGKKY